MVVLQIVLSQGQQISGKKRQRRGVNLKSTNLLWLHILNRRYMYIYVNWTLTREGCLEKEYNLCQMKPWKINLEYAHVKWQSILKETVADFRHGLLEYPDGKLPFHVKNLMGPMETKCHSIRMKRAFVLLFLENGGNLYGFSNS